MDSIKNNQFVIIFKGAIFSIIATLVLLFIYSAILAYTSVSESTIVPVIIILTGISILIGSSLATAKIKKNGLINGGAIGGIHIGFIYLVSSIIHTGFAVSTNSIIMIVCGVLAGVVGGIVGVNIK